MLDEEDRLINAMRGRLKHLNGVLKAGATSEQVKDYFLKRLNRAIIDYLLRENYFEYARSFIDETSL